MGLLYPRSQPTLNNLDEVQASEKKKKNGGKRKMAEKGEMSIRNAKPKKKKKKNNKKKQLIEVTWRKIIINMNNIWAVIDFVLFLSKSVLIYHWPFVLM